MWEHGEVKQSVPDSGDVLWSDQEVGAQREEKQYAPESGDVLWLEWGSAECRSRVEKCTWMHHIVWICIFVRPGGCSSGLQWRRHIDAPESGGALQSEQEGAGVWCTAAK
jgi:hypothetical protein